MLSDDAARAPVWGLNSKLKLSRPAAVKTGTSNDWRDAWAVGYTPYVTVGVWTGNNNNEPTKKVESLTGGGVIWHNIMEELFATPPFQRLLAPLPSRWTAADRLYETLVAGAQTNLSVAGTVQCLPRRIVCTGHARVERDPCL
jgi:Membrane carboxypeptidase (penicillin-binding protein)